MNYYLGVNGGATKTKLVLGDELGKTFEVIEVGPLSFRAVSPSEAQDILTEGIKQLLQPLQEADEIVFAVLGIASIDTQDEEEQAARIFQPVMEQFEIDEFAVVNDSLISLVNGTDRDNAIVLIAGTGSNCFGENERGETAYSSGLDYLLSDQGSGYWIGRQALLAAGKSYDGRGTKTSLEQKVIEHFEVSQFEQLKSKLYLPDLTKTEVASVAFLVFRAAEQGDEVSQEIISQAVDELWLMVEAVVGKLELQDEGFDLVLEGSVSQAGGVIRSLSQLLKQSYPKAELVLPHRSAVYGALDLAMMAV